jgi:hypothetical protein
MATALMVEVERVANPTRMVHETCCDDFTAMCGARLNGNPRPRHLVECVVCVSMRDVPCPVCGGLGS